MVPTSPPGTVVDELGEVPGRDKPVLDPVFAGNVCIPFCGWIVRHRTWSLGHESILESGASRLRPRHLHVGLGGLWWCVFSVSFRAALSRRSFFAVEMQSYMTLTSVRTNSVSQVSALCFSLWAARSSKIAPVLGGMGSRTTMMPSTKAPSNTRQP